MFQRNTNLPTELQSLPPDSPQLSSGYLYRRQDSTQMAISSHASGGASSYQSTHRHESWTLPNNMLPMPHNRSFESFGSMSLPSSEYQAPGNSAGFSDQMMFKPVLPYDLERAVCNKLDGKMPLGNDWRRLAAAFKLDGHIDRFDRSDSPTRQILCEAQCRLLLESPQQLIYILKKIDRPDVARVISENYGRFYTQPVDSQQDVAEALPCGQRPALDYSAHQSPPSGSIQGNMNQPFQGERQGRPEVTSPLVGNIPMRQSPDTPGSGTATVPESPLTPLTSRSRENQGRQHRGRNETQYKDQSRTSSSIGPTNVQPADEDDTIPELQVDSGVSNSTTEGNQTSNANYRRAQEVEMDNNSNKADITPGISSVENLAERLQVASLSAT